MASAEFTLHAPLDFWLDKSMPGPLQRKFGGLVSTECRDKQDEIVRQVGLDWSEFFGGNGWFNDNHSRSTTGPVGIPVRNSLKIFERGERLPNGRVAPSRGTYVEGILLGTKRAQEIWEFAKDLEETNKALTAAGLEDHCQHLGFSIEGGIRKRSGPDRKVIASAGIRNVAITNAPVNPETALTMLAKALDAAEHEDDDKDAKKDSGAAPDSEKALTSAAAAILSPESLDRKRKVQTLPPAGLRKGEAFVRALNRFPHADPATIAVLIDTIYLQSRQAL